MIHPSPPLNGRHSPHTRPVPCRNAISTPTPATSQCNYHSLSRFFTVLTLRLSVSRTLSFSPHAVSPRPHTTTSRLRTNTYCQRALPHSFWFWVRWAVILIALNSNEAKGRGEDERTPRPVSWYLRVIHLRLILLVMKNGPGKPNPR